MIACRDLVSRGLDLSNLSLPAGLSAVIGLNGAGKTTLLELATGLLLPERGEILVDGRPPREVDAGWVAAFPERSLLFSRVRDEVASACRFAGLDCGATDELVRTAAQAAGIEDLLDRSTLTLSGGEKAVVSLAAALAGRPRVLALDEFDASLDSETLARLLSVVRDAGIKYVLWSTHDPLVAAQSDFVVALDRGRVAVTGPPALALFDEWAQETCR